MISLRAAVQRGHTRVDWLDSRHTFSFGEYRDPEHMGFGPMRVINEDRVRPGGGFAPHGHREMEIISYVLEGALEHRDSLGNGSVIRPGDVQIMSAGTGILHSEFNPSRTEAVHFLQIWILPEELGRPPRYDQRRFEPSEMHGSLRLVGSPDGRNGSIVIRQDVELYDARLDARAEVGRALTRGGKAWVQVLLGEVEINGETAGAGDGVAVEEEKALEIVSLRDGSELLVFDLP